MAHYAFVDENSVVVEVIVGNDEGEGTDWEAYYAAVRGLACKRTSYSARNGISTRTGGPGYRGNYAGIGYRFDPTIGPDGAFLPPETQPDLNTNV
jgi:hypothetical protein